MNELKKKIIGLLKKEPLSCPKLVGKLYPDEQGNKHKLKARVSYHLIKLKESEIAKVSHIVETPNSKSRKEQKIYEVYYKLCK
jgi:hypothetical protein